MPARGQPLSSRREQRRSPSSSLVCAPPEGAGRARAVVPQSAVCACCMRATTVTSASGRRVRLAASGQRASFSLELERLASSLGGVGGPLTGGGHSIGRLHARPSEILCSARSVCECAGVAPRGGLRLGVSQLFVGATHSLWRGALAGHTRSEWLHERVRERERERARDKASLRIAVWPAASGESETGALVTLCWVFSVLLLAAFAHTWALCRELAGRS